MWHSKWLRYQGMIRNRSLRPQQPGNDKNRADNIAMWIAPIRVYNHLSREIPFTSLIYRCCPFSGNGFLSQPLVIYIRYTQAKWVVGHVWAGLQDILVEPSVFPSRVHWSEGGSIPCHVGNPISNKRHAIFDSILYMERKMQAFCYLVIYLIRHYYNHWIFVSKCFGL